VRTGALTQVDRDSPAELLRSGAPQSFARPLAVRHRSAAGQAYLSVIRARAVLVSARIALVNASSGSMRAGRIVQDRLAVRPHVIDFDDIPDPRGSPECGSRPPDYAIQHAAAGPLR